MLLRQPAARDEIDVDRVAGLRRERLGPDEATLQIDEGDRV
jgi:hypothetical protein